MDLSDITFEFRTDMTEREDIIRCLRMLLLTPAGTCPLYRDFGIDNASLGAPALVAENAYAVQIMEKVDRYEPRVTVTEVQFEADRDGQIRAKVVLTDGQNSVSL